MPSDTSAHGGFVEVNGTRLHLEAWGDAGAPVLLCLHGLGGGTHFFGELGASLARQCRIIAIDLPGSGLSPMASAGHAPASFSFDAVADLVVALARSEHVCGRHVGGQDLGDHDVGDQHMGSQHVGIQPVYLLGHSMGTILALEVIRRAPDLAAGLIVVGGLPEPLPAARGRIRGRADTIRRRGIAGIGAEAVAANFSRRSQTDFPELTARFAKLFDRQDPVAYAGTANALAAWTARELPPLDRVPCLVITGEEDRYAPPDAIYEFARTLPAANTRIEIMRDCGHLPFLEQPAAFAAIVSSFLRECRGDAVRSSLD
jgi:3-oxoadipate enol-lactonase